MRSALIRAQARRYVLGHEAEWLTLGDYVLLTTSDRFAVALIGLDGRLLMTAEPDAELSVLSDQHHRWIEPNGSRLDLWIDQTFMPLWPRDADVLQNGARVVCQGHEPCF